GYGDLKKGCKENVLKRCKHEGPAVCGVVCGNGVIEPGEECDGTSLGAATCASLGFTNGSTLACTGDCAFNTNGCGCTHCSSAVPATGQTTCWDSNGQVVACSATGQDGDTRTGGLLTFVDNGDGTITDANTGLMWEKQSNGDGGIHDIGRAYTWDQASSLHVAPLNTAPCFAGHCDWRVPNLKELESILNLENFNPAVSPAFNTNCTPICTVLTCSCTQTIFDWSSTTSAENPHYAWVVNLGEGVSLIDEKSNINRARAVRGGS